MRKGSEVGMSEAGVEMGDATGQRRSVSGTGTGQQEAAAAAFQLVSLFRPTVRPPALLRHIG